MPVASARRPIESGSRPSSVASAAARSRIAWRVRCPFVSSSTIVRFYACIGRVSTDFLDKKVRAFYFALHGDRPPRRPRLELRSRKAVLRGGTRAARLLDPYGLAGPPPRVLRAAGRAVLPLALRVARRRHARALAPRRRRPDRRGLPRCGCHGGRRPPAPPPARQRPGRRPPLRPGARPRRQ